MVDIADLGGGLQRIDLNFQGLPEVIASYLIRDGGEAALVEVGPTTTLDTLIDGIQQVGIDPDEITKLIVTHIHLDHAGASGTFMRRFPRARLYVHEIGAPHMVDPTKLLVSAGRIWGDNMDRLWGPVEPVPQDRIVTVADGQAIRVGRLELRALYTPGHASHHLAYHLVDRDAVFTGDVAGVRLPHMQYVRPPTPPPDVDLEAWQQSVDRIRALEPHTLLLTHFGPFTDVDRHLEDNMRRLHKWAEFVHAQSERGAERDAIIGELQLHGDDGLAAEQDDASTLERYELATPYFMTVDGLLRYWRKRAAA